MCVIAGLPIHPWLGICSVLSSKVGVPAETKNIEAGEGVKAFYSLHAGDV